MMNERKSITESERPKKSEARRVRGAVTPLSGLVLLALSTACTSDVEDWDEEEFTSVSQEVHAGIDIDSSANDDPEELEAAVMLSNFWRQNPSTGAWSQISAGMCTGVVLDSRAIVTAGHCIARFADSEKPNGLEAGTGGIVAAQVTTWDRTGGKRLQQTADNDFVHFDAMLYDGYRLNNGHAASDGDLATLRVRWNTPAFTNGDLLSQVDSAEIYADSVYVGMRLDIYGWGHTSRNNPSSGELHTGRDNAKIRVDRRSTHWFRGSSSKANMCEGDSGGPALRWVGDVEAVVGLHSWATKDGLCAETDENQAFTRLAPKIDFIEDHLSVTCERPNSQVSYIRCE